MKDPFRIHAICVVKNEGDIVGPCLQAALGWADRVIVYDGQSEDDTWAVVRRAAAQDPRVIPWKQDGKAFQESLRAEAYNAFRSGARPGDWWCHLDADEFYTENPRGFLAKVPWPFHVVWGVAVEFYLTERDVPADYALSAVVPPADLEKLRHYHVTNSEPRFFRERARLVWPENTGWPLNMGPVFPKRILYKHYKYRSPEQMQRRLATRLDSVRRGFPGWEHARTDNWREKVPVAATLHEWRPGQPFAYEERSLPRHLEKPLRRVAKLALHGLGVLP